MELLEHVIDQHNANVFLMSHSNGFEIPPKPFVLKRGRDYPIVQQLSHILERDGYSTQSVLLDGICTPAQTKAIVNHFDVLISGRMHGAVAGLSQSIPTLILDYGHEPKALKLKGFARIIGDDGIITDPNNIEEMVQKVDTIITNRSFIHETLINKNQENRNSARAQFDELKRFLGE